MTTKMQRMLGRNPYVSTVVSVLASVLAVSGIVYAATTIGTNISVDGTSILTGAVSASSTVAITGNTYTIGTLGVGTTSPSMTFSVVGSGYFTTTLQVTGTTSVADISNQRGTAVAPSYTFTSDVNTGMWSSGADTLNFSTAGSERVTITSAGRVGIGSTTPSFALDVNGTTTIKSGIQVGDAGTNINQILAGTCSVNHPNTIVNKVTVANCTATGVTTSHKVLVTGSNLDMVDTTNSLGAVILQGASTTAADTIQIAVLNTATSTNIDPGAKTWYWFAWY